MVALKKTTDHRPVFLNLLQIRLPVCALVSILHRVTGVAIVLFFPILIFLMYKVFSLSRTAIWPPVYLWVMQVFELSVVWSFMYHVLAGIRHMFHDFTGVHTLKATVTSAYIVLCLWCIWILLTVLKVVYL